MTSTKKSLNREERRQLTIARIDDPKRSQKVSLKFVNRARDFFKRIGIPHEIIPSYIPDPKDAFFKGCWVSKGVLHFCPSRVQVGELLHECGHIALLPKSQWHLIEPGRMLFAPPLGMFSAIGDAAVEAWDYAAALEAGIPELAVFRNGFDGSGFLVWEQFSERRHPGFALLRFLGMSSAWGKMDHWLVGDRSVPATDEATQAMLKTCTAIEREGLVAFGEKFLAMNGECDRTS